MHKKLIAACVSLVALSALAIAPAMASANSEVQIKENGTALAAGAAIRGTNSGNILLTSGSTVITCTKAQLDGTISTNTTTTISGQITSASFKGDDPTEEKCTTNIPDLAGGNVTVGVTTEGFPWCLDSAAKGHWTIIGGTCGTAATLPFIFDLTSHTGASLGECTYERTAAQAPLTGTYNVGTSPLHLTVTANNVFTKHSGSVLCPSTGTLDGTFKLETPNGTELSAS